MATGKTSRSRGTGVSVKENGPKLEEGLNPFKSDKFDPDAYVHTNCSLNDKEIKQLCSYLVDLKKASAEEMRRSVYANYAAFIRTSKEISDLEGELSSIRNLLSTQAALIHGLAEGVHIDSLSISNSDGLSKNAISNSEDSEISDLDKWLVEFPDLLDVLLAERRVDEALAALDEGEHVVSEAKEMKSLNPSVLMSLQNSITERRQKLADQLAEAACQPSTRGAELRASISALKRLGDGPHAHSLLLNAHLQRYQYNMQSLRPSSTSYGGAYTAALAQLVFSAVAQAASDSLAIFGEEPAYTSELVMWATKQTEAFALLVKRHALASSAAAGGLRAAAECVQIALGHCSLLEARGLALCPVLLKLFRPSVEQALDANLKRIQESTAALAAADDWVLIHPTNRQTGRPSSISVGNTTAFQHKLTSSAQRFNLMVQDFFEDVGPLLSMQLGGQALEGLFQVFNSYVNMLIKALPGSMEEEASFEDSGNKIVRMAETEAQQIALLANASLLADELLPRAAMKLSPINQAAYKDDNRRRTSDRQNRHPEQREWRRRLASSVDRLKDTFCRQHALDLIFTEEGDSHLTADMYINMDGNADEVEWIPSLIFQELFIKLNRMTNIAADMFVGRERFATLLLMRLTETVMLWLSEDQSFWDDIEEGPRPLGPLGLQQVRLVTDSATNKPKGYAFIEYLHTRDMKAAYKQADGRKIEGRRVLVDVERGRTVPNWRPRRLGGGLGTTRVGGEEVNQRHSGREQHQSGPRSEEPRVREDRHGDRDREKSRERGKDKDRELERSREHSTDRARDHDYREDRHHRDRDRNRDRDKERERDRDRGRDRDRARDRGRGRDRERDHDRDREHDRHRERDRDYEVGETDRGRSHDRKTEYDNVESNHEKDHHGDRYGDYETEDDRGWYKQPVHGHRHADPDHVPDHNDQYEHRRGRGQYDDGDDHGDHYNQYSDHDRMEDDYHTERATSESRERERNLGMDREYRRSERSHSRE